jgi:hypothetical protein
VHAPADAPFDLGSIDLSCDQRLWDARALGRQVANAKNERRLFAGAATGGAAAAVTSLLLALAVSGGAGASVALSRLGLPLMPASAAGEAVQLKMAVGGLLLAGLTAFAPPRRPAFQTPVRTSSALVAVSLPAAAVLAVASLGLARATSGGAAGTKAVFWVAGYAVVAWLIEVRCPPF